MRDRPPPLPLLLRSALALLPRRFREEWREALVDLHHLRSADAGDRPRWSTLATAVDLLRTAAAERWASSYHPPRPPSATPRGGSTVMSNLLHDLRLSVRSAWRAPRWSALVALTLALGIGTATAIFTVVEGALLRPLPYAEAEDLLRVHGRFDPESGFDFPTFDLSGPELVDYRRSTRTLEGIAAYRVTGVTLTDGERGAERLIAGRVSPELLPLLRVEPIRGRGFTVEEGRPDGPPVALISHGLWRERYAGEDPLGRRLVVSGVVHTVVGVLPPDFQFGDPRIRLLLPLTIDEADPGHRSAHGLRAVARIAPGSDLAAVRGELEALMADWKAEYPDIHTGHYLFVVPLLEDMVGEARPAMLILLGCALMVLLIGCANVASLVLARAEDRGREVALRSALGASRLRLVRLLLLDGLVLAALGGVLGVVLAQLGVRLLLQVHADGIPRAHEIGLHPVVLLFALAATVVTALLFSLAPAFQGAVDLRGRLVESADRGGTESGGRVRLRQALVAGEAALCFVLVLGAGLLARSLQELLAVDPGFRVDGIHLSTLSLPETSYPDDAQVTAFARELAERAGALPGVESAAVATYVPLYAGSGVWDFDLEGRQSREDSGGLAFNARFASADERYFSTLEIPVLRGRAFEPTDRAGGELVAVVNREFARRFFADSDPLDQRIRVASSGDPLPWARIVGVVGDDRSQGLDAEPPPVYTFVLDQTAESLRGALRYQTLVVRTSGDPAELTAPLRSLLRELDPDLPLIEPQTMAEAVASSNDRRRFTTLLLVLFALVAVALGASGIHGVLAYTVSRRTRELGIRSAFGARPGEQLRLVVAQGMAPVLVGLGLGAVASVYLTRLLEGLLFAITPGDPLTVIAVAVTMLTVAFLACLAPALWAMRLSPVEALRDE